MNVLQMYCILNFYARKLTHGFFVSILVSQIYLTVDKGVPQIMPEGIASIKLENLTLINYSDYVIMSSIISIYSYCIYICFF